MGDGKVGLYHRDQQGYKPVQVAENAAVRRDGTDTLQISETGTKAQLFVNGVSLFTFEGSVVGTGEVGIAAAGAGTYTFNAFRFGAPLVAQNEDTGDDTLPGAPQTQPAEQPPAQQPQQPTAQQPQQPIPSAQETGTNLMGAIYGIFFHETAHA